MDKYSHFCYDFSDTMRVRFPLLYMIELQNSLQLQVEERTKEFKEEKNNSEKLLIELTQASSYGKALSDCRKYIGQTGFEPAKNRRTVKKNCEYMEQFFRFIERMAQNHSKKSP